MTFTALIEPTRTGYSGYFLEFGGRIIAVGDTPDEVATFLQDAAVDMLEDMRSKGEELPSSGLIIRRLEVA